MNNLDQVYHAFDAAAKHTAYEMIFPYIFVRSSLAE